MSLTVTPTPGKQFADGELITTAKLNQLGQPTFAVTGTMGTAEISAGAVTAAKSTPDAYWYAAGTLTSNTYAVTLSPALAALTAGAEVWFKADNAFLDAATTGICLLNVNGLGAVAIKKYGTVDLAKNDIRGSQVVGCRYDGTNWEMFSQLGNAPTYYVTGGAGTDTYTGSASPAFTATAHLAGARIVYKVPNTNTGAASLNLNTTGAVGIKKYYSQNLAAGDLQAGQTVDLLYDGSSFQMLSQLGNAITPAAITGSVRSLVLKATAASGADDDLTITADDVVVKDGSGVATLTGAVTLTLNPTGSGANGFDSGAPTTANWYYVWVIWNGTTAAALGSTSNSNPTMPTGYTSKGLVGEWYYETTTNPRRTIHYLNGTKRLEITDSAAIPAVDTNVQYAHRLGGVPKFLQVRVVNTTTEFNYAVGDEIPGEYIINDANSGNWMQAWMDATNITAVVAAQFTAAALRTINRTTYAMVTLTKANWRFKFIAER